MEQNQLSKTLTSSQKKISDLFAEDEIEDIKTDAIKEKVKDFVAKYVRPLTRKMDEVAETSDAPVYVGMLGRYSHGKSALVNAMFGLEGEDELPTGEGVVTSQVTVVNFDTEISDTRAYEVYNDDDRTRHQVPLEELRTMVKSENKDTSNIAYYEMNLPTNNKPFATEFSKKRINLIDLPGLGGPYFNDSKLTNAYIRDLDMIICAIRIDQIEEAARHIRTFIENTKVDVIPVLTYEDLWNKSDIYSGLSHDEMIRKAIDLIAEYLPTLKASVATNTLAVSAITKTNIDQLRRFILSHVETEKIATRKTTNEVSAVYKRKSQQMTKDIADLRGKVDQITDEYKNLISSLAPQESKKGINLNDVFEKRSVLRSFKNTKKESERAVKDFYDRIVEDINGLSFRNTASALKDATEKLNNDIQGRYKNDFSIQLRNIYEDYKKEVQSAIFEYIGDLTIDEEDIDEIKEKLDDEIKDFSIDWDNIIEIDKVSAGTKIDGYIAIGTFKKIKSFIGLGGNHKRDFEELKEKVKNEFLNKIDKNALKEVVTTEIENKNGEFKQAVAKSFDDANDYNKDIKKLKDDKTKLISLLKELKTSLGEEQRNL